MRTRQIATSLLLPLAFAISSQALAAEPTSQPVRSAEYARGYDAIVAKDWSKAYEIFLDLRTHSKSSDREVDVLLNLGQAELGIGKYRDAAEHLSIGILLISPADVSVKERASKNLDRAKKKVSTLTIVAPDGTEVTVNGKIIGTAPIATDVFVDPASTKVMGKHPTKGTGEMQFDVKAGEERKVELTLKTEPSSVTGAPPAPPYSSSALDKPKTTTPAPITINPPPPIEKKSGMETKTIVLIAGGVVTLAATGVAVVYGLKARSAKNDAESMLKDAESQFGSHRCSSPEAQGSGLCADIDTKSKDRTDAAAVYNVALPIAGAAALATGLIYVFWPSTKTTSSRSFTLVPVADQRTGGVLLQGGF